VCVGLVCTAHSEEFPNMPPCPDSADVVLVDGPLADDDFSKAGAAQDRTVAHIIDSLTALPYAEAPLSRGGSQASAAPIAWVNANANASAADASGASPTQLDETVENGGVVTAPPMYEGEEPVEEVDQLLEELMDLYQQQHEGEEPTDAIVHSWMEQLREANAESEARRDVN
jgi:hypothetical protein